LIGDVRDILHADGSPGDAFGPLDAGDVGLQPRSLHLCPELQPTAKERERRRECDEDRRRRYPPAPPESPGKADDCDDREHRETDLAPKSKALHQEPADRIERPEFPPVLPPEPSQPERQCGSPQREQDQHAHDDRGADPTEPDATHEHGHAPNEDDERSDRRDLPEQPKQFGSERVPVRSGN